MDRTPKRVRPTKSHQINNYFSSSLYIRRFAYIEFADKDAVQAAVGLDESLFRGRQIKVNMACQCSLCVVFTHVCGRWLQREQIDQALVRPTEVEELDEVATVRLMVATMCQDLDDFG